MNESEFYDGAYTGQQIDSAVGKVVNADATPTLNSTNMVTSGGVKSALNNLINIQIKRYTLESGKQAEFAATSRQFILLYPGIIGSDTSAHYLLAFCRFTSTGALNCNYTNTLSSNYPVTVASKKITIQNGEGSSSFFMMIQLSNAELPTPTISDIPST